MVKRVATMIAVYTSQGCIGRCDARCYGATELACECICAGANHGVGFARAADNTAQYAQRWIERHQAAHPDHDVVVPGLQQDLGLGRIPANRCAGAVRARSTTTPLTMQTAAQPVENTLLFEELPSPADLDANGIDGMDTLGL